MKAKEQRSALWIGLVPAVVFVASCINLLHWLLVDLVRPVAEWFNAPVPVSSTEKQDSGTAAPVSQIAHDSTHATSHYSQ